MRYDPDAIVAATRAMCRELYGDNFDLHDHGSQDPEGRASLERAAEATVEAYLEKRNRATSRGVTRHYQREAAEQMKLTRHKPPMMTYEQWLKNLDPAGIGLPSSPTFAEAYRLYVARFDVDQTPRERVRAILFDRWNLDSIVGNPRDGTIEETLDEIEAAYRNE